MRFSRLGDWLKWMETLHPTPMELGLERVRAVAERLGLRASFPPVLLIGGTNGKGSTVRFLEAILQAAGHRVGSFTSPHLFEFAERIRIDGKNLGAADIIEGLAAVDSARGSTSLTYFEFATLAALLAYKDCDVDLAVLEVGLGGRLDAVNITNPMASLVTNIGLDHQRWLGTTHESIAREKVGIARAERPFILGDRGSAGGIRQLAEELGARVWQFGQEYDLKEVDEGTWSVAMPGEQLHGLPYPSMMGPYQLSNAAGAIALLQAAGIAVSRDAIGAGLVSALQPGRFQRVQLGNVDWIFDVAHNELGGKALAAALGSLASVGRTIACVGAMADKDFSGIVAPLIPMVDEWLTAGVHTARGADPLDLARNLNTLGASSVEALPHVAAALDAAAGRAEPGDRIVVFGSFHVVAPALTHLRLARIRGYNPDPA